MRFRPGESRKWRRVEGGAPPDKGPPDSALADEALPLPSSMLPDRGSADPPPDPRRRRWSLIALLVGVLIGLRLLAAPSRPALAPAERPWRAEVTSLTLLGGDPATLEVKLTLYNDSPEALRRVKGVLLLPSGLKGQLARTTYWDPLLDGKELDYWAPQTSRSLTFGLKLAELTREEALTLLDESSLRLGWSPADLDPYGTHLEQTLSFADIWRGR